jgi:hypothetical protein
MGHFEDLLLHVISEPCQVVALVPCPHHTYALHVIVTNCSKLKTNGMPCNKTVIRVDMDKSKALREQ